MARMKDEDLERIVRRDMPGYRLTPKSKAAAGMDASRGRPRVDAGTPDLETLRRKYASRDFQTSAASSDQVGGGVANADDDAIVTVERESGADPLDPGSRPKAVVISGRNNRIVGKQG
jgi:hypothetical protein